ncbi:hypothetical protein [uncultured Alistipes sp.]|jgi:hypothetical protein|uniref:hypothetical protein n=1 Tax=uncultured Alistipes sp. TaxID=538949 RepID=UPI00261F4A48|nr:hypothetical protein [uncultured Alistipes sp.]
MENTTELGVRFYAPKTNTNPCYTPLRFVVTYSRKRLSCIINVPALDAKELDKINPDCTLKQGYWQAPAADVSDTLQKIRDIIQGIAEEAIKLDEWDNFTSADLKRIVSCLFYWICDPNVIRPKDNASGLCWQWICHKKGIKL